MPPRGGMSLVPSRTRTRGLLRPPRPARPKEAHSPEDGLESRSSGIPRVDTRNPVQNRPRGLFSPYQAHSPEQNWEYGLEAIFPPCGINLQNRLRSSPPALRFRGLEPAESVLGNRLRGQGSRPFSVKRIGNRCRHRFPRFLQKPRKHHYIRHHFGQPGPRSGPALPLGAVLGIYIYYQ